MVARPGLQVHCRNSLLLFDHESLHCLPDRGATNFRDALVVGVVGGS